MCIRVWGRWHVIHAEALAAMTLEQQTSGVEVGVWSSCHQKNRCHSWCDVALARGVLTTICTVVRQLSDASTTLCAQMEECGPQQQKQQQEAVAAAAAAVAAQAARLAAAEEGVRGLQGQVEQQGQGAAAVAEQLQKLEAGVQEARAAAEKATAAAAAPAPGLDPESAARLEALEAALAKEAEARGKVLQEHAQVCVSACVYKRVECARA